MENDEACNPDRKLDCWPQDKIDFNLDARRLIDQSEGKPWITLSGILHHEKELEEKKLHGMVEQLLLQKSDGTLENTRLIFIRKTARPGEWKISSRSSSGAISLFSCRKTKTRA